MRFILLIVRALMLYYRVTNGCVNSCQRSVDLELAEMESVCYMQMNAEVEQSTNIMSQ